MKHLNNKNATNRLIFAGVLIFVLCLSALLVHIIDVHEIFFEHSKDAIINHMETGMSLMNEEISDLNDMSLLCETALAEREEGQSIGHVLAELQAVYTDYEFFYLSESGVFHSPTITIENLTPSELLGEIYSFEYKDHFICLNGTGLDENGKEISKMNLKGSKTEQNLANEIIEISQKNGSSQICFVTIWDILKMKIDN